MKVRHLLALALAACSVSVALADDYYRNHRYDSFMGTPPPAEEGKQIVFFGNSITNMHNWTEAFGSDINVVNRGNSGGYAYELIEQLESFINTKPAKVFIGIGTNDLATHGDVNRYILDMELLVKRIHIASPETQVYIQSILPRASASHSYNEQANARMQELAPSWGVTFIDLSDVMAGVRTTTGSSRTTWAPDGLHPAGLGYREWTRAIKDYVNGQYTYLQGDYHPDLLALYNPSRVSQFSLLPVDSDDILFLGDEMVENGEWNELLRLPNIKKRANGYGHGGVTLCDGLYERGLVNVNVSNNNMRSALGMLKASLESDTENQEAPKQIIIYCGVAELTNSSYTVDYYREDYQKLVDYITTNCPSTKILGVSILDVNGFGTKTTDFNQTIADIAAATPNMEYCDIYTPVKNNVNTDMRNTADYALWGNNYVNGRGYVRIANTIAPFIEGANPVSLDECETYYANRKNRRTLGKKYNETYKTIATGEFGTKVGGYSLLARQNMQAALGPLEEALAQHDMTADQVTALSASVDRAVTGEGNMVLPSVADGKLYRLTCYRGSRVLGVAAGALNGLTAATTTDGGDVWRFTPRADGSFDIVSLDGNYMVPFTGSASVSVSVSSTRPDYGWQFSESNVAPRTVCIYAVKPDGSGCQLNGQNNGANVWNWGFDTPAANGGTSGSFNSNDQGCAFYIDEFTGTLLSPNATGHTGGFWKQIKWVGGDQGALITEAPYVHSFVPGVVRTGGGAGLYSTDYVAEASLADSPASSYFYVMTNESGTTVTVTSPDGRYIMADGRSSKTVTSITMTENADGTYSFKWIPFNDNTSAGHTLVGTFSSGNAQRYQFINADMTNLDVWSVRIEGTAAPAIQSDLTLTLGNNKSRGVSTVYNNGSFFVEKGTVITAEDLTVGGNTADQTGNLRLKIDPSTRSISVSYVSDAGKWYTLQCRTKTSGPNEGIGRFITVCNNGNLSSSGPGAGSYESKYLAEADIAAPGYAFVYITPSADGNTWVMKLPNGHYIDEAGRSSTTTMNVGVALQTNGDYQIKYWIPWNFDGGMFAGRSGTNTSTYTRTEVDMSPYDVWTVETINAIDAFTGLNYQIGQNLTVTIPAEKCQGLNTVYNNGNFFTVKGTQLSAADITIGGNTSAQKHTPAITVNNVDHTITVDYTVKVTGLSLDVAEKTLRQGQTLQLNAKIEPAGISGVVPVWASSAPQIASVNIGGFVTAHSLGECVIAAEVGAYSASCKITVVPAPSISISQTEAVLHTGETLDLTVTADPADFDLAALTWTSSDAAVASVEGGHVVAVGAGDAVITAAIEDLTVSCAVHVNPILAESVTLSETELSLTSGETVTLVATVLPADADDKTIVWTSSNEAVVLVDADGKVTALAVGNAIITATCGEVHASCVITVIPSESDGIYSIRVLQAGDDVYDLAGRKVTDPVSGRFYIVNGRKVLAK